MWHLKEELKETTPITYTVKRTQTKRKEGKETVNRSWTVSPIFVEHLPLNNFNKQKE